MSYHLTTAIGAPVRVLGLRRWDADTLAGRGCHQEFTLEADSEGDQYPLGCQGEVGCAETKLLFIRPLDLREA